MGIYGRRRRRAADRITTWGTGVIVAGAAPLAGASPLVAATAGLVAALGAAAVVSYGRGWWAAVAHWYREHTVTFGLWLLAGVYVVGAAVVAWLRWGA
jgi:hypothetical protein